MGISGTDKALMYALGNVMRGGASRGGYHSGEMFITIGGAQVGTIRDNPDAKVVIDSLQIDDALDETPNTCTLKLVVGTWAWGTGAPPAGTEIIVTMGSQHTTVREFAGTVLATEASFEGRPVSEQASVVVHAIDYTYLANQRKVSGFYQTQSATGIATDLITRATTGITIAHVQAGLPVVDEFTVTNQEVSSALTALAKRVGAYWYIDYVKDLHFFLEETALSTGLSDPQPITPTHLSLAPEVAVTTDASQVVTRVFVEGGGVNVSTAVAVGESVLPVEDVAWYAAAGGTVAVGTQRLTYTGVRPGGGGTVVGPGAQPTAAPTLALALGSGLSLGEYRYAYTFVTASGESLPSPLGSITTVIGQANPVLIGRPVGDAGSPYASGGLTGDYAYKYTFQRVSDGLETAPTPASPVVHCTHYRVNLPLAACETPPSGFKRRWYRTAANGSTYKLLPDSQINTGWAELSGNLVDTTGDAFLGAAPPASTQFTGSGQRVTISDIGKGPTGTVQRKLYRTVVGGTPLKFLVALGDNTTTVITDTVADAGLGATAPTVDTSALSQPSGQVLAGASSLILAATAGFTATGGWAVLGNGQQVIRYTGISGLSLIGIPFSGPGAITASVAYNSSVTESPALTGVAGITRPIKSGDAVNLLVQLDDPVAQSQLAAVLGGDGVIEEYLQDGRLGRTEALSRARAKLVQQSMPLVTVTYRCRDRNTRSGRTVAIDLETPVVHGSFKIQHVTVSTFGPHVLPTYTVTASSARFSFENLLRLLRGTV
jgi:hypothetical protein